MSKLLFVVALAILFVTTVSQTKYITANVDPVLVANTNFNLNMLKALLPTYNWIFCNKTRLQSSIKQTYTLLKQIRSKLPNSNIVQGQDNLVVGNYNYVFGNRDRLVGVGNWILVSNYDTGSGNFDDSILAIGSYKINLQNINFISVNPSSAISPLNPK